MQNTECRETIARWRARGPLEKTWRAVAGLAEKAEAGAIRPLGGQFFLEQAAMVCSSFTIDSAQDSATSPGDLSIFSLRRMPSSTSAA